MKTSAPRRLEGVQQLRFFAAFAVLVHHVLEEASASPLAHFPAALVQFGAAGVDIFFVVSGLVMWHTTGGFAGKLTARQFFARRLVRIMPPYWACLAAMLVLWRTGVLFRSMHIDGARILQAALLMPPTTAEGMIVGVSWTLVYEIYFYAICTAVLLFPRARWRPWLIPLLLAAVPAVLAHAGADVEANYYRNPIVVEFAFGIFVGWVLSKLPRLRTGWLAVALCVGVLYGMSAASTASGTHGLPDTLRWWAWGIPAAGCVACFACTIRVGGSAGRVLTSLGDASYVLYLTHSFFMVAFARLVKSGLFHSAPGLYIAMAALVAFSTAFGYAAHVLVERPVLARLQNRTRAMQGSALT